MLFDISLSNFFDMSPHARKNIAKRNKWDYIKLKSFCTVKETFNKIKKLPTKWKKNVNDSFFKGLILKMFKKKNPHNSELKQQQQQSSCKRWEDNWNRHFLKEDIQTG